jgi:hypothetical protein
MELPVGILVAKSSIYPLANYDFRDGISMALAKANISPKWHYQDIGFGNNLDILQEKTLKLSHEDGVKAIFSLADSRVNFEKWKSLANLIRVPIAVTSFGAYLNTETAVPVTLLRHSLELWKSYGYAGVYFAQHATNLSFTMDLHESGYAFAQALFEGISIIDGQIPRLSVFRDMTDFPQFEAMTQAQQPDAILAGLHGTNAVEFLEQYAASTLKNIPLYGTDILFHEDVPCELLTQIPNLFVFSIFSDVFSELVHNSDFGNTCAMMDASPTIFTMLGYETGVRYLAEKKLSTEPLASFRGGLDIDVNRTSYHPKHYLHQISIENNKKKYTNLAVFSDESIFEAIRETSRNQASTGWRNPYLFI